MHNFRELQVWKKARTLAKDVYVVSAEFPHEEKFGFLSGRRVPVDNGYLEWTRVIPIC